MGLRHRLIFFSSSDFVIECIHQRLWVIILQWYFSLCPSFFQHFPMYLLYNNFDAGKMPSHYITFNSFLHQYLIYPYLYSRFTRAPFRNIFRVGYLLTWYVAAMASESTNLLKSNTTFSLNIFPIAITRKWLFTAFRQYLLSLSQSTLPRTTLPSS